MGKHIFKIFSLLFLGHLVGGIAYAQEVPNAEKPNVIIIYTDQQRYNTIAALGNGFIQTPNIDKLVKNGVAFTNSFVTAPVCTPSRWSLFSGMYTTSHQTYSNHHISKRPPSNLAQELKEGGYKTALVGKNHSFLNKKDMDIIIGTSKFPGKPEDDRSAKKAMEWSVEEDPMHILTDTAMSILASENQKPVFMWLSYLYPHTPYALPEPYFSMYDNVNIPKPVVEPNGLEAANKPFRHVFHKENNDRLIPYDDKDVMRMKRNYYGMITMVDEEIGRLFGFLESNNMLDNTLIVFTSDHGDYMGDHGMVTKSPSMYDCLTRVPLIWLWKGHIKNNVVTDELISNVDVMPTILSLLGQNIPGQVQGKDYAGFLTGKAKNFVPRDYVFAEYGIPGQPMNRGKLEEAIPEYKEAPIYYNNPGVPWEANPVSLAGRFRMIRSKEWKFVQEIGGTSELYNMTEDPYELHNLIGDPKYARIQSKLESDLNNWKSTLPGIERDAEDMSMPDILNYKQGKRPGMSQH